MCPSSDVSLGVHGVGHIGFVNKESDKLIIRRGRMGKKRHFFGNKGTPGINFTNLMAQGANALVGILWYNSVSPTKLCPICLYTQLEFTLNFYAVCFMLCTSQIAVKLLVQSCRQNIDKIDPRCQFHQTLLHKIHTGSFSFLFLQLSSQNHQYLLIEAAYSRK